MANSKYAYIRTFESDPPLLPHTYIVIRLDGRSFHKLCSFYSFTKPNDYRALGLMNAAAIKTMCMIPDIMLGYGVSDEFSFVFERETKLFERRRDKLVSTVCSTFTAAYVALWDDFFVTPYTNHSPSISEQEQQSHQTSTPKSSGSPPPSYHPTLLSSSQIPTFDARAILYPTPSLLRDYLSWRQVDCHINNLYNTTFWSLVQLSSPPMSQRDAEEMLKGTVSSDKNEILWSRFGVNYNAESEWGRKGSIVYREMEMKDGKDHDAMYGGNKGEGGEVNGEGKEMSKTRMEKQMKAKMKAEIVVRHCDIIKDDFWDERPWLLGDRQARHQS